MTFASSLFGFGSIATAIILEFKYLSKKDKKIIILYILNNNFQKIFDDTVTMVTKELLLCYFKLISLTPKIVIDSHRDHEILLWKI